MSSFYDDGCDWDPRPKREKMECECEEDPSIRSLRRQLVRLEGKEVTIIADNFFSIVMGTVNRVTMGTVTLSDATVFGVPAGRVIIALSKINLVVPTTNGTMTTGLFASMRSVGIFNNGAAGSGILGQE